MIYVFFIVFLYDENGRKYVNYFIKFVICYVKICVWFELYIMFWEWIY